MDSFKSVSSQLALTSVLSDNVKMRITKTTQGRKEVNIEYLPNLQEGSIVKNLSETEFHKVYKVPSDSTSHKTDWFSKGVWGLSPQATKKYPALFTVFIKMCV